MTVSTDELFVADEFIGYRKVVEESCGSETGQRAEGASDPTLSDISDHLVCGLCEEGLSLRPVRTRCGHRFCLECLSQWLKVVSLLRCPLCGDSLVESSSAGRLRLAFSVDDALVARCAASRACERTRLASSASEHLEHRLQVCRRRVCGPDIEELDFEGLVQAASDWGHKNVQTLGLLGLKKISFIVADKAVAAVGGPAAAAITHGTEAVFGSLKLASWLNGVGGAHVLRSPVCASAGVGEPSVWLLNLLPVPVVLQLCAAKRRRKTPRLQPEKTLLDSVVGGLESALDYVLSGGPDGEEDESNTWYLEPYGEPLAECIVRDQDQTNIQVPASAPQHLLLHVVGMGRLHSRDIGAHAARRGSHFVACRLDEHEDPAIAATAADDSTPVAGAWRAWTPEAAASSEEARSRPRAVSLESEDSETEGEDDCTQASARCAELREEAVRPVLDRLHEERKPGTGSAWRRAPLRRAAPWEGGADDRSAQTSHGRGRGASGRRAGRQVAAPTESGAHNRRAQPAGGSRAGDARRLARPQKAGPAERGADDRRAGDLSAEVIDAFLFPVATAR